MAVGVHIPLRFLRAAVKKGLSILKERIPATQTQQHTARILEPAYSRLPGQGPRPPYAQRVKVAQRWHSTSIRNALRDLAFKDVGARASRAPHVRAAVGRLTVTTPFASTLRPRLVGGAMPRSAGGYSIGGSARFFSHTPAAPAQVISQVTAAMRVLATKGKVEHLYRGTNGRAGVRAQLAASLVGESAPGAYVDFYLSPTLTCLSPLNSQPKTLGDEGFLQSLGADFGAMLGALAAVYSDIKKLSQWGDFPITLVGSTGDVLRVHFRGHSGQQVESICNDIGIKTGVVHEDERFAFNLLAPEPELWGVSLGDSRPVSPAHSEDLSVGYHSDSESCGLSDYFDIDQDVSFGTPTPEGGSVREYGGSVGDYDGLGTIHEFLENCRGYPSSMRPPQQAFHVATRLALN